MKMRDMLIEGLEAGLELDALVAEFVMGEKRPNTVHDPHIDLIYSNGLNWFCLPKYDQGDVCNWIPFYFSSEWQGAYRVIEHMIQLDTKDHWFSLEHSGMTGWQADFRCLGYGDTAPLAICRAALIQLIGEPDE